MSEFETIEKRFEQDIETSMMADGWLKGDPKVFDRKNALDVDTLVKFVSTSQPKEWEKYSKIYGAATVKKLVERFSKAAHENGLLHVLRHGITDRGIKLRFVFWKPETSINQTAQKQYESNIFHVTRQLHYSLSNENSIDVVLFINGIPVVSMELKCQFTGQSIENAIQQYKFDRDSTDKIFNFKERVLAHFAVDLTDVFMTTKLEGKNTTFIPFNRGSNGAGKDGGRGNPGSEDFKYENDGYLTSYLWHDILAKDSLLDILNKYMHLQQETVENKAGNKVVKEKLIFPRYHQLDVVKKLIADVRTNGAGVNYLIQHSAGSGKSNSIAWLAYRLSGLHDAENRKIFQSVIIVTDRRVLDKQLQDTVYQFEHVNGVVKKVDKNSKQLRDAINAGVPIIISTLHKFPVIWKEIDVPHKNFAIIVDEAHSSQTGEAAKKLKQALADTEEVLEEFRKEEAQEEANTPDEEDELNKMMEELAAQGAHKNLSFFAFTATPKGKTIEMFGTLHKEDGKKHPFHVYSMRQAIEEGFILDVLRNYVTYSVYYKILKEISDDPTLDTAEGVKEVLRYETLHPHNIAQKTAIMVEHFRSQAMQKIGGHAKAMVVTASRLHTLKYLFEFRKYIEKKGYKDLSVLVAFSGELQDQGEKYTEEKLNKNKDGDTIKELQLPSYFHTDDFNVLIVADKYQTGFDEPYLNTMYVDKVLSGVKAVQTLSRLNRTMKGKSETFVLDFVNKAEDILAAFAPYYQATYLEEETDPNILYDIRERLDKFNVYQTDEVEQFCKIFYKKDQDSNDLGRLMTCLQPAKTRYMAMAEKDRETFKTGLGRFVRIYSFVTQVYRMFDKDLHKFFVYARFLDKVTPKGKITKTNLDDKISMEYFKLEKSFDGEIRLTPSDSGLTGLKGTTGASERTTSKLSEIIDKVNKRFGTKFTDMDKVLEQVSNDFVNDQRMVNIAKDNDITVFTPIFEDDFKKKAANRYEQNDQFFVKMFEDPEFMNLVIEEIKPIIYDKLRKKK